MEVLLFVLVTLLLLGAIGLGLYHFSRRRKEPSYRTRIKDLKREIEIEAQRINADVAQLREAADELADCVRVINSIEGTSNE